MKHTVLHAYTDGGSRGNPGHSAFGVILCDANDIEIVRQGEYLGKTTNNVAEYRAVICALEVAQSYTHDTLIVTSDSQLLVRQLNGEYSVKAAHLKPLYERVVLLSKQFKRVQFIHQPREHPFIIQADALVNETLDKKM